MRSLLLLSFLIFSLDSFGQASPAVIFNAGYGKIIPQFGLRFNDLKTAISGSLDPSAVAVDAPQGSLYISSNGGLYQKQDNGSSTNWTRFYIFPSFANDNRLIKTDGLDDIQQTGITVDDSDNVTGISNLSYGSSFFTPLTIGRVTVIDPTSALTVSTVTTAELEAFGGDIAGKLDKFPSETNDNRIARTDGNGDTLQGSLVSIDDAGVVSGATQLNVDNIRLDDNTISSTDTNGNIIIDPNGTGVVNIPYVGNNHVVYTGPSGNLRGETAFSYDQSTNVLRVDGIDIGGTSTITTHTGNQTLTLDASGTGIIDINAPINIESVIANQVPFADNITGNLEGSANFLYSEATDLLRVAGLDFENATIESVATDQTITIDANGTGILDVNSPVNLEEVTASEVAFSDGVTGNIVGSASFTYDSLANSLTAGLLNFIDGIISSTTIDGDVTISPDGTGELNVTAPSNISDLRIDGNEISPTVTNEDLKLIANGTGDATVTFDGTTTQTLDRQVEVGELIPNNGFERTDLSAVSCTNATITRVADIAGGEFNDHALQITATGTPWSCDIDGAGGQGTGFAQLQSIAMVASDAEFCILTNGVEQACHVSNILTSKSETFSIPTVLDGAENSIRIKGTSASNVVTADKASMKAGQLTTTGYYREAIIDIAGSGEFTTGVIKVTSNGETATISPTTTLTHPSDSSPSTAVGSIPSWALPSETKGNISWFVNGDSLQVFSVATNGTFTVRHLNTTYGSTVRTSVTSTGTLTYQLAEAQTVRSFNSVVYGSKLLATSSTTQTISTVQTVTFSSATTSNGTFASNQFTVDQSGWYEFKIRSQMNRVAGSSAGTTAVMDFRVNSTVVNAACEQRMRFDSTSLATSADSTRYPPIFCFHEQFLTKGDVVDLRFSSSDGSIELLSRTFSLTRTMNPNGEPVSAVIEGYPRFTGEKKNYNTGWASFGTGNSATSCTTGICGKYEVEGIGSGMSLVFSATGVYDFESTGWAAGASVYCTSEPSLARKCNLPPANMVADGSGVVTSTLSCYSLTADALANAAIKISCTGAAP
jgi:hypothetical protein